MKDTSGKTLIESNCKICGNIFYKRPSSKQKFCSLLCSNSRFKNSVELFCDFCNKEFSRPTSKLKNSKSGLVFCSRSCKQEAQVMGDSRFDSIRPDHYGTGESTYRTRALKEYGERCNRCAYSSYVEILQVHHKDKNRTNGSIENLEVLCPNCHAVEHYVK